MLEYQIVKAEKWDSLEASVRDYIGDGWSPIGGVSVTPYLRVEEGPGMQVNVHDFIWCQAMTRDRNR